MSQSIHKKRLLEEWRLQGATEFEKTHQTMCGFVRDNVTSYDDDVTCKLCLREMKKQGIKINEGKLMKKIRTVIVQKAYLLSHAMWNLHESIVIYADSYKSAKKAAYKEWGDGCNIVDFIKAEGFNLKRIKDDDKLEAVRDVVLARLSDEEVELIRFALNAGDEEHVSRNHFFALPTDPMVLNLRKLDLITEPVKPLLELADYQHYALSPKGVRAALSTMSGNRRQLDVWFNIDKHEPDTPQKIIQMEDVKRDKSLLEVLGHVYIRSGEWGSYWCPEGAGYTSTVSDAGVYSAKDAFNSTSHCGPEKRIGYVQVDPAELKARIDHLQSQLEEVNGEA